LKDLTKGSVWKNLLQMSAFLAGSMLVQSLYFLADLYWVGKLGKESVAAVGFSANLMVIVLAVTQSLGVGTAAVISQAVGEKNQQRAVLVFNQSFVLSQVIGVVLCLAAFLLRSQYCHWMGADGLTSSKGVEYLTWFIPALFLQFALFTCGAALRGTGVVKPTVVVLVITVALNLLLAPVLVFGWGLGHALGVAGAAIATFLAIFVGVAAMALYFFWKKRYIYFDLALSKPINSIWGEVLRIGLPAGGELVILAIYLMMVYSLIRGFGASAQAGFGIGARVMQSLFLPALAVGMAAAPVAGQNFGARSAARVRQSFYAALTLACSAMLLTTLLCQWFAEPLIRFFSTDLAVIAVGADYLRVISFTFVATGVIFATSSMFQGMGNTIPPLLSSSLRLVLFSIPALILSRTSHFTIRQIWLLSAISVFVQAIANLLLARREFERKLNFLPLQETPALVASPRQPQPEPFT
jgi:putative MATE family efflux protein